MNRQLDPARIGPSLAPSSIPEKPSEPREDVAAGTPDTDKGQNREGVLSAEKRMGEGGKVFAPHPVGEAYAGHLTVIHTVRNWRKHGPPFETLKMTPLRAIRRTCVECIGGNPRLVDGCTSVNCALYPYRNFGTEKWTRDCSVSLN